MSKLNNVPSKAGLFVRPDEESFANKMILKYNILTLKKQRIVDQIQCQNDQEMSQRFLGYLSTIEEHIQKIQRHVPDAIEVPGSMGNYGSSLEIFMEVCEQFVALELQTL